MKTVNIYKAQPTVQARPVESVTIVIDREIPEINKPTPPFANVLDEARAIYRKEAVALADALEGALPGGVVDQLLAELMGRRASLLRVPLVDPPPLVEYNPATGETRQYYIDKDGIAHHSKNCDCMSCLIKGL